MSSTYLTILRFHFGVKNRFYNLSQYLSQKSCRRGGRAVHVHVIALRAPNPSLFRQNRASKYPNKHIISRSASATEQRKYTTDRRCKSQIQTRTKNPPSQYSTIRECAEFKSPSADQLLHSLGRTAEEAERSRTWMHAAAAEARLLVVQPNKCAE